MSDRATRAIIKRRRWAKRLGAAFVGALVAGLVSPVISVPPAFAFKFVEIWAALWNFSAPPDPDTVAGYAFGFLAGPLVGGIGGFVLSGTGWGRTLLDYWFADPPTFARRNLVAERSRVTCLMDCGLPPTFIGRESELDQLRDLAGDYPVPFRWCAVTGPSGIGKTRLAIEWLVRLNPAAERASSSSPLRRLRGWFSIAKSDGWDVGVIDAAAEIPAGWRARRRTALVVDDATRSFGERLDRILVAVALGGRASAPVRVVVVDHLHPPERPFVDPEAQAVLSDGLLDQPLRLAPLDEDQVKALWMFAGGKDLTASEAVALHHDTAGRPRAVIVRANFQSSRSYSEALADWACRLAPALADNAVVDDAAGSQTDRMMLLSLSVLAGPVGMKTAAELVGSARLDPHIIQRFFPDVSLDATLPPIEPEDLGQEVLLRALAYLTEDQRRLVIDLALRHNAAGLQRVLVGLWQERPEAPTAAKAYHGLPLSDSSAQTVRGRMLGDAQLQVDTATHELRDAQLQVLRVLASSPANPPVDVARETIECIRNSVTSRPFDAELCLEASKGLATAIHSLAAAFDFEGAEAPAQWIVDQLNLHWVGYVDDPVSWAGTVCACLMQHYGDAQRLDDLERWGETLKAVYDGAGEQISARVHSFGVRAAGRAIAAYGRAPGCTADELKHWDQRLHSIVNSQRRSSEILVRREEAVAASSAIIAYTKQGNFHEIEAWGLRLQLLLRQFKSDLVIRQFVCQGAQLIVEAYANAGRMNEAEKWAMAAFRAARRDVDQGFCILKANAAFRLAYAYARGGQIRDMERWVTVLASLVPIGTTVGEDEISLLWANAIANSIPAYGDAAQNHLAEEAFETLLKLVDRSSASPTYVELAAMAAYNIIFHHCTQDQPQSVGRIGERLTRLINLPLVRNDPRIWLYEARAAAQAAFLFGRRGSSVAGSFNSWLARLAKCSIRFPRDPHIQEQASRFRLTAVEQERMGWPFGMAGFSMKYPPQHQMTAATRTRSEDMSLEDDDMLRH